MNSFNPLSSRWSVSPSSWPAAVPPTTFQSAFIAVVCLTAAPSSSSLPITYKARLADLIFELWDRWVFIGHFRHKVNVFSKCEPVDCLAMRHGGLTHFPNTTSLSAVGIFRHCPQWLAEIIGQICY